MFGGTTALGSRSIRFRRFTVCPTAPSPVISSIRGSSSLAVVFALHEQTIHPRPLGNTPIGIIHRSLPIRLVIDGIHLASVSPPLSRLGIRECHAQHHGALCGRRGRRVLMMLLGRRLLMVRMRGLVIIIPPPSSSSSAMSMKARMMSWNILLAHHATRPVHASWRRGAGGLAEISLGVMSSPASASVTIVRALEAAILSLATHLRYAIGASQPMLIAPALSPIIPLAMTTTLFLLLLFSPATPALSPLIAIISATSSTVVILLGNLIADTTHLVEATFRTVSYYYFPSSEYFLFAEADCGVADAAALFIVFGSV